MLTVFPRAVLGLLHNMLLLAWSMWMWTGASVNLLKWYHIKGSMDELMCDRSLGMLKGALGFYCYWFYVSKYYELFDTVLMVLRKRPLTLLHCWHHVSVLLMCYSWMQTGFSFHWWGLWWNTMVHCFMYYYYAAALLGRKVWWKRYLTLLQLLQFSTVFVQIFRWLKMSLDGDFFSGSLDDKIGRSRCAGHLLTVVAAQLVNISYLALFANFYRQTYNRKNTQQKRKRD